MTRVSGNWRSISVENKQLSLVTRGLIWTTSRLSKARELKSLPNRDGKNELWKQLW
jgi:hypothetical protein